MSSDPEAYLKLLTKLDKSFGHFNKTISALNQRISTIERASTKVIGIMSQTRGMQLGFVADLDLLGGAFGRVKRTLANMFLPLTNVDKGFTRFQKTFSSWGNMWKGIMKPMGTGMKNVAQSMKKGTAEAWKSHKQKSFENKLSKLYSTSTKERINILSKQQKIIGPSILKRGAEIPSKKRVMGKAKDLGRMWGGVMNFPHWEDMLTERVTGAGRYKKKEYVKESKFMGYQGKTFQPTAGMIPSAFMGLGPLTLGETERGPREFKRTRAAGGAMKEFGKISWGKMGKASKFFGKEVMQPLRQVMGGGIGLGFQTQVIMGLMQAFSNVFTIFQPVIDIVSVFAEMIGTAFMPIIEALLTALTSPEMMSFIEELTAIFLELFTAIAPIIPIIISLILIALQPLKLIAKLLTVVLEPLAPVFDLIAIAVGLLADAIDILLGWIIDIIDSIHIGATSMIVEAVPEMLEYLGVTPQTAEEGPGGRSSGYQEYQSGSAYVPYTGYWHLTQGEEVITKSAAGKGSQTIINIDGGIWVQDMDEFIGIVARKLKLYSG